MADVQSEWLEIGGVYTEYDGDLNVLTALGTETRMKTIARWTKTTSKIKLTEVGVAPTVLFLTEWKHVIDAEHLENEQSEMHMLRTKVGGVIISTLGVPGC